MPATSDDLRTLGFKWSEMTIIDIRNDQAIMVRPKFYLKSRESINDTERSKKKLRIYDVQFPNRRFEEWDEAQIEDYVREESAQ